MERSGMKEMKISCNVADFIRINNEEIGRESGSRFHYISGQADANLLHIGSRIHQACNRTSDCGENMVCNPNPSKDGKENIGYCECPNESIRIQVEKPTGTEVLMNTFVLVIDNHYDELVCAKKRTLNESCQYDQQCSSFDPNSYCRPIYSPRGFATRSSICDCSFGFVEDRRTQTGKCINVYSINDDEDSKEKKSGLPDYRSSNYPTVVPKEVYVWWIIRPKNSNYSNRITSTYRFLWQRYSQQRYITQLLMAVMLFIPFILLLISSVYIHCYRRMIGKRQYKPTLHAMNIPPPPPSITSNEQQYNNSGKNITKQNVQPISMMTKGFEFDSNNNKEKKVDKMELIKNDQLNQFYQIQFQQ
ncbi:hypothetical protein BLA29_004774 [Euroglyphus maynei]|uniref:EB domain-containing protein n=1 Tax=Euroglyphus maynei TaxID=6958 RepID=A0A1Y3BNU7_EURMA|nr:hypothetical protein BLA29_004774 [Euroglyphus maynei]